MLVHCSKKHISICCSKKYTQITIKTLLLNAKGDKNTTLINNDYINGSHSTNAIEHTPQTLGLTNTAYLPTVPIWSGQSLYYYLHPTSCPLLQECLFCPAPALEWTSNAHKRLRNMDWGRSHSEFSRIRPIWFAQLSILSSSKLCRSEKPVHDSPESNGYLTCAQ